MGEGLVRKHSGSCASVKTATAEVLTRHEHRPRKAALLGAGVQLLPAAKAVAIGISGPRWAHGGMMLTTVCLLDESAQEMPLP